MHFVLAQSIVVEIVQAGVRQLRIEGAQIGEVVHGLCRRDGSRPVAGAQRHNFQDVAPVIRYSLVRRLRDSNPCEFARLL